MDYQQVHHYDSVEELNSAPHGWDVDISPLRFDREGTILAHSSGTNTLINLAYISCPSLQRGSTPAGMRTFCLPLDQHGEHCFRGHSVERNTLIVFPPDRELYALSKAEISLLTFSITQEALDKACQTLELPTSVLDKAGEVIDFAAPTRQQLLATLNTLAKLAPAATNPRQHRALEEDLVSELVLQLAGILHSGKPARRSKRYRVARSALEQIHSQPREAHTVSALAMEAGASRRTLEIGFREMLDMSPKQYTNTLRLRGCRSELLRQRQSPHTSVTEIARNWGFIHFGQFAADFRKMFGELPSDTLRAYP